MGGLKRSGKGRPVDPAYLERAALHYLERFPSSADNLRRVLHRKAKRRLDRSGASENRDGETPDGEDVVDEAALASDIAAVVARAERSGLVDDRSFATMTVGSLARRGASPRAMRLRLRGKGVADELIAAVVADGASDELALARRLAERKRLGAFRRPADPALHERDLAALCRAGFSYRVAQAALAGTDEDPEA